MLDKIKDLYEEKVEMESNNRGRIKTMLNKETGDVWNDFFVGEGYKEYESEAVVEVPVTDFVDDEIFKSFPNAPKTEDIAMAIMEWIERKVKDWSENHAEN